MPVELSAGQSQDFLAVVLKTLVDFKSLPKYQFERRIDAFIAVFLPELLDQLLGGRHVLVTPEFPLKKSNSNQSTNVDYLLHRMTVEGGRWIFFELKTDDGSFKDEQLMGYRSAARRGMGAIRKDLEHIVSATKAGWKYQNLVSRLATDRDADPIDIVYLAPADLSHVLQGDREHAFTFADLTSLDLTTHPAAWSLFKQIILPALA